MANNLFKGIFLTTTANTIFDKDVLYFVRTNSGKTDGYLQINGKKYGTSADALAEINGVIGALSSLTTTEKSTIVGAINELKSALEDKNVDAEGDELVSASAEDNKVTVAATEALETAVANANSALQEIEKGTDGDYVTTTVGTKADNKQSVAVSVAVQSVSTATAATQGLADAYDVKDYVDNAVADKNVDATGDTYVTASAADNKVTVAASESTKASLALADSALQSVSATGDSYVSAEFAAKGEGTTQALTVATTVQDVATADADNKGLAEASDVKSYVDGKFADGIASATYDSTEKKIFFKNATGDTLTACTIDATAFIKDGMLETAEIVDSKPAATEGGQATAGHFLKLTWNTDAGKTPTYIDLADFFNPYTADEETISLSDGQFSAIMDQEKGVASYAALQSVSGATTANTAAIETLNGEEATAGSVKNTVKSYIDALDAKVSGASTNVTVTVTQEDGVITKVEVEDSISNVVEGLDATAKTEDNVYVNIEVVEADGKLTTASVTATDKLKNAVASAETAVQSVTSGTDTLISASTADKVVTLASTEALTTAVSHANSAVQNVNGETGTAVTLDTTNILIGTALENENATAATSDATVNTVLSDIYTKIAEAAQSAELASSDKTITVTAAADGGNDIVLNREAKTDTTVAAGHIAIEANTDGTVYGAMYYSGDDVE